MSLQYLRNSEFERTASVIFYQSIALEAYMESLSKNLDLAESIYMQSQEEHKIAKDNVEKFDLEYQYEFEMFDDSLRTPLFRKIHNDSLLVTLISFYEYFYKHILENLNGNVPLDTNYKFDLDYICNDGKKPNIVKHVEKFNASGICLDEVEDDFIWLAIFYKIRNNIVHENISASLNKTKFTAEMLRRVEASNIFTVVNEKIIYNYESEDVILKLYKLINRIINHILYLKYKAES